MNELAPRYKHVISETNWQKDSKFLQTALQYFFDNAIIPIYSGNTIINLMDYFPMMKQGYVMLENQLSKILLDYIEINNLINSDDYFNTPSISLPTGYVTPDALFIEAFGADIPAFYYIYIENGVRKKVIMQHAIESGLISDYLNTFQVISMLDPNFQSNRFSREIGITWIIALNVQIPSEVPELTTYLQNEEFKYNLWNEASIISNLSTVIHFTRQRMAYKGMGPKLGIITVTRIMEVALPRRLPQERHLVNRLLADPRVNKLIYAIIINDPVMVEQYINVYDPRDNNYEAYHLAVRQGNNPVIINIIKKSIAERNLLEQQTFQTMMIPLGESDIPQTEMFHQYSRSLINK